MSPTFQEAPSSGPVRCSDEPARSNRVVGDGSVLIDLVEGHSGDIERLGSVLQDAGYRVRVYASAVDCRAGWNRRGGERAGLVIVDTECSGGLAFLLADLGVGGRDGTPVIAISATGDLTSRLSALQAGASRFLVTPADADRLLGVVEQLTGARARDPYRVLLVDDEPTALAMQAETLRASGLEVMALSEPLQFLEAVDSFVPDVVVLDVLMPGAEGPELAAVLRERDPAHAIPILYLSGEVDPGRQLDALSLGGDDFLVKPVAASHLVTAVTVRAERGRRTTETKRALDSMLYERRREHLALDRHAIVSVADRAGIIIHVNDRFCEVSGYSRAELLGQDHRIVKSGLHSDEFYRGLWRTIAQGEIWKGEICNRRKDRSLYWVESTIVPFLDAGGRPYQYVSIRTDITHVKNAAERLRISQNHANIGTWDWDLKTGTVFWSQPIAALFGLPDGAMETTFERFLDAVHPEDRQGVIDAATACIERGEKYDVEHRCVWSDGTVRWLAECGDVLRDADGTPRNMLGVVQDVTDRKALQIKLQTSKDIVDSVVSGVVLIDELGTILLTNPSLDRIFGYRSGELVGADVTALMPEAHKHQHPSYLARYKETRQATLIGRTIEIAGRRKDGDIFPIEITVSEITEGERSLFVGIIRDITDRKRSELALATEQALLRQAQRIARLGNWEREETSSDLRWSATVFDIFGWDPEAVTPTLAAYRAVVHPDDLDLLDAAIASSSETGRYDIVHRIIRPDGETRYLHVRGGTEFDPVGDVTVRRGVVQDITELKRTEAALHASNARQHIQLNAAHCLRDITKFTLDDELSDADMLSACIRRLQESGLTPADTRVRIRHGGRLIVLDDFRETLSRLAAPIPFFEEAGSEIEAFGAARAPNAGARPRPSPGTTRNC